MEPTQLQPIAKCYCFQAQESILIAYFVTPKPCICYPIIFYLSAVGVIIVEDILIYIIKNIRHYDEEESAMYSIGDSE